MWLLLWVWLSGGGAAWAATATVGAPEGRASPLYRVCVESVVPYTEHHWIWSDAWPYVWLESHALRRAVVRLLPVESPSWMWERPVLRPGPALPARLEITSSSPRVAAGTVLYIDAEALDVGARAPAATVVVEAAALRANVRRVYSDSGYDDVERCALPEGGADASAAKRSWLYAP